MSKNVFKGGKLEELHVIIANITMSPIHISFKARHDLLGDGFNKQDLNQLLQSTSK